MSRYICWLSKNFHCSVFILVLESSNRTGAFGELKRRRHYLHLIGSHDSLDPPFCFLSVSKSSLTQWGVMIYELYFVPNITFSRCKEKRNFNPTAAHQTSLHWVFAKINLDNVASEIGGNLFGLSITSLISMRIKMALRQKAGIIMRPPYYGKVIIGMQNCTLGMDQRR